MLSWDELILGGGSCQPWGHYSRSQGKQNRDDGFKTAKEIWISSRDQFEALQVRL